MSTSSLPTFLVIGARKAGTTSLFNYLSSHPEIFMPAQKEIHFFSDQNWHRGLAWYRSLFAEAGKAKAIGEASPGYSQYPLFAHVPERIAQVLPDVRLIYVVRNPVDRVISSYRQDVLSWGERRPIDEALLDFNRYLSGSMYSLQIERYLEHFDRRQLLVITSGSLRDRRVDTLRKIYSFLGVEEAWSSHEVEREFNRAEDLRVERPTATRFRGTPLYRLATRVVPKRVRHLAWILSSRPMRIRTEELTPTEETRRAILERLRPDLARLPGYLGEDFDCWGLLEASESG